MRWLLAGVALPPAAVFLLVTFATPTVGAPGLASCLAFAVGAVLQRPRLLAAGVVGGTALVLTIGTLAIARTVTPQAHPRDVAFGYPLSFVRADLGFWDPPYPRRLSFNPWEDPASLSEGRFLASYAIVLATSALAALGVAAFVRRLP